MRNLVRKYALAEATNPMAQQAFDYGTAGLVGATGQQLANWATGGDDPNPLLSGALFSPLGALAGRAVRNKYMSPTLPSSQALGMALDESIAGRDMVNPIATGALMASAASGLASTGTNAYNLVTGSNAEPSTAVNALSSIAPLSYFLLGQRNRNQSSPFVGLPSPRV
jgi:hypothetical protein